MLMAAWRRWSLDASRFAKEIMPPAEYLRASYYERWLWGIERTQLAVDPAMFDCDVRGPEMFR